MRLMRAMMMRSVVGALALGVVFNLISPGVSQEYVIGAGDTVELLVRGEPQLSHTYLVRPDGILVLPLVGELRAAGLTSKQLADKIAHGLRLYVRDPQVTVSILRSAPSKFVYVLGQVVRPGAFEFPFAGWTVAELLASAGGPTPNAALRKATILRKTETILVDLEQLLVKGDAAANVALQPGDVFVVSMIGGDEVIHVLGEVAKPGYQEFHQGDKLLDVITKAGGVTLKAAPERISILREIGPVTADLVAFLHKGRWDENVPIQKGDIVFVPETENRVVILGEVVHPGSYIVKPGDRLVMLLSEAGGPTPRSNLKLVGLVRQRGEKTTVVPVDLDKFFREGDSTQNAELKPGDVVYVPEQGIFSWSNALGTITQMATLFVLFK